MRSGIALFVLLAASLAVFHYVSVQTRDTDIANATIHATMATTTLTISSPAFEQNERIPAAYTCDERRELNPPLTISGAPAGTRSLVLIVDDPDVPKQIKPEGLFVHWVLFNIPPDTVRIGEGEKPGTQGVNGSGNSAYTGPCPPPQYEPSEHRYFFKLYALDTMLELSSGATKEAVEIAMKGHVLSEAQLMGTYKRK